ncbi:MAG: hypothetical protein K8R48_06385 [Alphaproteobacteria bacterium]|nr:hypothetical protein [Alphaproteobacteria bacterium]
MKKMILAAAAFATMIGSASTGAMAASEQSKDPMMILGKKNTEATAATAITSEPAPPPVSTATMATAPEQVNLVTLQSQDSYGNICSMSIDYESKGEFI